MSSPSPQAPNSIIYVEQPFSAGSTGFSPYNFLKKAKTQLRIAIHPGVIQGLFNQILPHFNYLNPHVKVKTIPYLSLGKKPDLNLENVDIFVGPWNPDYSLKTSLGGKPVVNPLFNYTLRFFASKTYIDKPERAENIHNLMRHPILGVKYSDLLNKPDSWHLLPDPQQKHADFPLLMTIDHLSNFMLAQDGLAVVPWASEGIFWSPVEMVPVFTGIRSAPIPVSFIVIENSALKQEISNLYKMLKEIIVHFQLTKNMV